MPARTETAIRMKFRDLSAEAEADGLTGKKRGADDKAGGDDKRRRDADGKIVEPLPKAEAGSPWSKEEDQRLLQLVKLEVDWKSVVFELRGRTVQACQTRLRYLKRFGVSVEPPAPAPRPSAEKERPRDAKREGKRGDAMDDGDDSSDVTDVGNFIKAIRKGDTEMVVKALSAGVARADELANLVFKKGERFTGQCTRIKSPLHNCAEKGDAVMLKLLLDAGFSPNVKVTTHRSSQNTPLDTAAKYGHADAVVALIKGGADVCARDATGAEALATAAADNQVEAVKALLKHKANVDASDVDGYTALHWASDFGHPNVVRALLDARASVTKTDKEKNTALHWSAHSGDVDVVRRLLK